MPLLRTPWSTPSSSASNRSASSRSSSVSSTRSASSATHNSRPGLRTISQPIAKRVHVVDVPVNGRPSSQSTSLLLVGKEGKRDSARTLGRSSRRMSAGQGREEEGRGPLFQPQRVKVVVTATANEGEGKFAGLPSSKKGKERESTESGLPSRQKRFSLFTIDSVAELEKAEEGAVLLWMQELSASPHYSFDHLPSTDTFVTSLPGTSLSTSLTAPSSPSSFNRLLETPSPSYRPFTPPPPSEGSFSPSAATPKARKARLPASPTSTPKSSRTASSSASPSSLSSRLFHPSRWGRRSPIGTAIAEGPDEQEQEEGDVFGPMNPPESERPSSPGRSLGPATARLGASLSDPSLVALPSSSASHSTFTPRPSSPSPNPHLVRFASSSDPPPSSFVALPNASTATGSSTPGHSRTPSSTLDHLEWEFLPRTVPRTYESPHGQGYAPPIGPRGRVGMFVRPHPVVRARKSFREKRGKVPVPAPPPVQSSERSASRAMGRSDKGGGARKGKEKETEKEKEKG